MSQTLFMRPDRMMSLFGTVSGVTADAGHELDWLVDGRPGFPLRVASGTGTITIANSAKLVNLVAICYHLLDAGLSVALGGDLSGSIVIPQLPPNGVPLNGYEIVDEVMCDSFTLAISGNSGDIVIGEVVAGLAEALEPSLRIEGAEFGVGHYLNGVPNPLSGIPAYSERARDRTLRGSQFYDIAQLQAILDWFDSQDSQPYPVPSLLIPDSDDPTDARLVFLSKPRYTQEVAGVDPRWSGSPPMTTDNPLFLVELEFTEIPRTRW